MNHIKIYEDEVSPRVYKDYANLAHSEVCDGFIVFYTVGSPHAIEAVCKEYKNQSEMRETLYSGSNPDSDQIFTTEFEQRELAHQLISLIED